MQCYSDMSSKSERKNTEIKLNLIVSLVWSAVKCQMSAPTDKDQWIANIYWRRLAKNVKSGALE